MVDYNPEDWENIPQIIPTSISSVSKHLQSIDAWMRAKDSEETTMSLSMKMSKQEHRLLEKLELLTNEKEKQLLELSSKLLTMNAEIEKLKEKPKVEEAVVQTNLTMKDLEDHSDISEDEHTEGEDPEIDVQSSLSPRDLNKMVFARILKKKKEDREVDMQKPRMYSLEIFKKLMFKYLNRSKLKTKVLMQQQLIPNIEQKAEDVNVKIDSTVQDFSLEIKNIYEQLEFYKENLTKLYSEVEDKLKDVSKWSERVEQKFTEFEQNQEDLKLKNEVSHEEYDILKQFTKRLEDKIGEVSKELKEDSRKKVESTSKNLRKDFTKSIEEIQVKIEETNSFIEEKYKVMVEEYSKAIVESASIQENNTKELGLELAQQISDYRKFYECDMESFQKVYNENRVELVETDKKTINDLRKLRVDFDKWVATVMEPAHISEARIFTVEARVKEEEAARLDQLHFVKDVIRKLLFSLEQAQINNMMPGIRPVSRNENDPSLAMYLKRLGFLKKLVQYSVDQQKTRGNFVRKNSPFTVKEHFNRSMEETTEPFITEKNRFKEDNI